MSVSIRIKFEPLRSLDFSLIGPAYMGIGTAVDHPLRQFMVQNLTDAIMSFSWNGVDEHFVLPSQGFFLNDITSNKTSNTGFFLAEGERLYVSHMGTPPTEGAVYFTTMYSYER